MRVGILYGDPLKRGGISAYSQLLAAALKRHGYIPYLLNFKHLNSPLYRHPTSGFRELMLTVQLGMLARHLSRRGVMDILWSNAYYGAFAGPDITVFHFTYPGLHEALGHNPIKVMIGKSLEQQAANARLLVAVSEFIANEVWKFYRKRSVVIENAIDTERFTSPHSLAPQLRNSLMRQLNCHLIALFVGRFTRRKGADIVINLARKFPDVGFVMVLGYGQHPDELPHNVIVFSQVPRDNIPAYYQAADVVVFPTRYEPFGYITVEGWASGKIVLTTGQGVAQKLRTIQPFKNWVSPTPYPDTAWFENAMKRITAMGEDERNEIGKEGQAIIEKYYNLPRWGKEVAEILSLM